jgi:hypothetical protein
VEAGVELVTLVAERSVQRAEGDASVPNEPWLDDLKANRKQRFHQCLEDVGQW